jgi:hypothetical protein
VPDGTVVNPYETFPALPFSDPEEDKGETENVVTEGTSAMRAYQEMLYGVSRNDDSTKERWRRLLLQYCELDTAAMVRPIEPAMHTLAACRDDRLELQVPLFP